MLGHPEAVEAEGVDVLGEGDGVLDGLGGRGADGYGGLVEDGEAEVLGLAHGDWMCWDAERRLSCRTGPLRAGRSHRDGWKLRGGATDGRHGILCRPSVGPPRSFHTPRSGRRPRRALLIAADHREGGAVFAEVGAAKVEAGALLVGGGGGEDGAAEVGGAGGGGLFDVVEDALGAEGSMAAWGVDDTLGDDEELCARLEGLHGGVEGEVGEEAERHGDVGRGRVPSESWRMAVWPPALT